MEVFNNWEKSFDQLPNEDPEAVGLDGEQIGIMCMREVDDSLQDQFMFFYKGKKVKFTDIRIIVYGEK